MRQGHLLCNAPQLRSRPRLRCRTTQPRCFRPPGAACRSASKAPNSPCAALRQHPRPQPHRQPPAHNTPAHTRPHQQGKRHGKGKSSQRQGVSETVSCLQHGKVGTAIPRCCQGHTTVPRQPCWPGQYRVGAPGHERWPGCTLLNLRWGQRMPLPCTGAKSNPVQLSKQTRACVGEGTLA
jgi:hypothetical protein